MWYVIQTLSGQEEKVRQLAEKYLNPEDYSEIKILNKIVKKRYLGAWHEVKQRLLPGYQIARGGTRDSRRA